MNFAKQKLILEYLISSKDLYARCASIIKSSYFDPELRQAVIFVEQYYAKYSTLPKLDKFEAEFDLHFDHKDISRDDIAYISDECEIFAKESAIKEAIQTSMKDLVDNNFDKVTQNILNAVRISLDRDMGVDLYQNIEQNLINAIDSLEYIPTGIKALDKMIGGGCARKQFTLFSANSGVGKSVLMSNLGDNYAASGFHVVYFTLELPEDMVLVRLSAISTGKDIKTWKENIPEIASKINDMKENGAGSYVIKRLKNGSTTNDMRSYLKQYEMMYNRKPDVIIADYLDIMQPIGGITGLSISEQDKAKSEQLYEIGVDYDAIIFSASQQNRDGINKTSPDQTVIAGGFNKINIVDNYISIYMTPQMRLDGLMLLYYLKTRSAAGGGDNTPVKFNPSNLQITDVEDEGKIRQIIAKLVKTNESKKWSNKNVKDEVVKNTEFSVIKEPIQGLPIENDESTEENNDCTVELRKFMSFITG